MAPARRGDHARPAGSIRTAQPPEPAQPDAAPEPPDASGHVLIPITKDWGKPDKNLFYDLGAV